MTHVGCGVRLLLGSTNRRKIREWRLMLDRIPVELVDPHQLGLAVDAAETGETPEQNARIKAIAYCDASGVPAFSLDAALRIEGLADDQQPGVHVRRIGGGESATDARMVRHYSALLRGLGGDATGEWTFGVALACDRDHVHTQRLTYQTTLLATPSPVLDPGAPLNSLQFDTSTGKYFSEVTPAEYATRFGHGSSRIVSFITRHLVPRTPIPAGERNCSIPAVK
jgi:8-oxo-dGTP diphosphatase